MRKKLLKKSNAAETGEKVNESNRLLPLVVADSASFFYDTKLNKKNL
jgi:hypothetical protein